MQYLRQFCKRYDQSSTVSILRHRLVPPTNPVSQRRHLLPELPSWTSKKRTGSRHNRRPRLPSTIYSALHCCIPRKKKSVRDAMDHGWPDRVCSHVTVGERNKTGLNSAGGRCWTTQGDENRRHKSPPDKKKKKNQIVALLTHDRSSCICILGLYLYRLINSYLPEGTLLIEYNTLSKPKKKLLAYHVGRSGSKLPLLSHV